MVKRVNYVEEWEVASEKLLNNFCAKPELVKITGGAIS